MDTYKIYCTRGPALLLLLLLTLSHCTDDSFSQLVDVPIPEHTPLPVLSLDLVAGDTSYLPVVGRSFGILEDPPIETERTTTLRLLRDDVLFADRTGYVGDYEVNAGSRRQESLTDTIGNGVATYRAEIEVEGIGTATAEQRMPTVPAVEIVSYERDGAVDIDGTRIDVLNVVIDDPGGTDDFYALRVYTTFFNTRCLLDSLGEIVRCDSFPGRYPLTVDSPDPIVRPVSYDAVGIADRSFSGTRRELRLEIYNYAEEGNPLELTVEGLTDDGFRYLTSKFAAEDSRDNPFAEPVTVHTNITGGLGIFTVSSQLTLPITD